MTVPLYLSMLAALVLSFAIPVLFWGRFGFRKKGFAATAVTAAACWLLCCLIMRRTVLLYAGALGNLAECLVYSISYGAGLTLMNVLLFKFSRIIGADIASAFAAGSGMALAESAVVAGMPFINNLFYSTMLLNGTFASSLEASGVDSGTIMIIEETLCSMAPSSLFLCAFERMFFSVSLVLASVLLSRAFLRGKRLAGGLSSFLVLFLAYFLPSLLFLSEDGSLVFTSMSLLAVLSVALVWFLGRKDKSKALAAGLSFARSF